MEAREQLPSLPTPWPCNLLLLLLWLGRSDDNSSSAALHRLAGPRRSHAADFPARFPPEIPQLRCRRLHIAGKPGRHPLQRGGWPYWDVHSAGLSVGSGAYRGSCGCVPLRAGDATVPSQHGPDSGMHQRFLYNE